jgi:hypothetical protein
MAIELGVAPDRIDTTIDLAGAQKCTLPPAKSGSPPTP